MIKEPTADQSRQACKILMHVSDNLNAVLTSKEEREKLFDIDPKTNNKTWHLLPAFVVDSRYWCGWDVYYGHNIVVDLLTTKAWTNTQGIFEKEFVFISDSYGFSEGAFYFRTL